MSNSSLRGSAAGFPHLQEAQDLREGRVRGQHKARQPGGKHKKHLFQRTKPFLISFSTLASTETTAGAAELLPQASPETQPALGLGCSSGKMRQETDAVNGIPPLIPLRIGAPQTSFPSSQASTLRVSPPHSPEHPALAVLCLGNELFE